MRIGLTINNKDYDAPVEHLVESLGVLPHWVTEFNLLNGDDLKKYLDGRYGYGLYEFKGTVKDDGTYVSPHEDDEDLPFVGRMKTAQGMVYFYPYAMVGIPTSGGYFVTRMD